MDNFHCKAQSFVSLWISTSQYLPLKLYQGLSLKYGTPEDAISHGFPFLIYETRFFHHLDQS